MTDATTEKEESRTEPSAPPMQAVSLPQVRPDLFAIETIQQAADALANAPAPPVLHFGAKEFHVRTFPGDKFAEGFVKFRGELYPIVIELWRLHQEHEAAQALADAAADGRKVPQPNYIDLAIRALFEIPPVAIWLTQLGVVESTAGLELDRLVLLAVCVIKHNFVDNAGIRVFLGGVSAAGTSASAEIAAGQS